MNRKKETAVSVSFLLLQETVVSCRKKKQSDMRKMKRTETVGRWMQMEEIPKYSVPLFQNAG